MSAAVDTREYVHLLQAIQDATQAIAGQPDSPAVARRLAHRAACYRRLADQHPRSELVDMARHAAAQDQARADSIINANEDTPR